MSDDLTLKVDGKALSGWTEISVTRSLQQMPNTFAIAATRESALVTDAAVVREGAPCTVSLGKDVVVTGYCDQVMPAIGAGYHAIQIAGRGKCQDLVDCAAEWKGSQVSGSNMLEIAQKLATPYGITASCKDDPGPVVPQFNINVGDSPADILELVGRHAGLLYYEGADGNLVLAELGTDKAGSGFAEGQNVQAARYTRSTSGRYSEYVGSYLSVDTSGIYQDKDGLFAAIEKDPNVPRHRRLVVVAEGVAGSLDLLKKRILWECVRRAGRSTAVMVTVDSWRDAKGKLWSPNTLADIALPTLGLKHATWTIAEVTFRLSGQGGRTADVLLMPQESFELQPVILQPLIFGATPAGQAGA